MIACSKLTVLLSHPRPRPSSWFGAVNLPMPRTTVTLRCLARPARPPVSFLTTPSFQPRSLSMSTCGAAKEIPCSPMSSLSAITLAACRRALEGMQPTLRQTPPRVASARQGPLAGRDRRRGMPPCSRPDRRRGQALRHDSPPGGDGRLAGAGAGGGADDPRCDSHCGTGFAAPVRRLGSGRLRHPLAGLDLDACCTSRRSAPALPWRPCRTRVSAAGPRP